MYAFFCSKFGRSVKLKIYILVLALAKLSGYMSGCQCVLFSYSCQRFDPFFVKLLSLFKKNKLTEVPASPYTLIVIVMAQKNISVTPLDCVLCKCSVMSCFTFVLIEDNYVLDKCDVVRFNVICK